MIKSEKKLKELIGKLNDKNINTVSSSITALRDEEPFSGAIRLLTEVFDKTEMISLKQIIRNFMNDMKESEARPEIITEIRKPYKPETISMLVSSCWQSGLDYAPYASDLLTLFLQGDYIVSLECLTVIEESLHNIPTGRKNEMLVYLEENKGEAVNEKSALINELLSMLR
jgi:hypothetical protein